MTTKITSASSSAIGSLSAPKAGAVRPTPGGSASASGPAAADKVSLTGDAVRMQQLEKSLSESPDNQVDLNRVAAAKAAIANGTYKVDSKAVAAKLSRMESALAGA